MPSYVHIALPDSHSILGLNLEPFCLGHYILLSKYGCSFVAEDSSEDGKVGVNIGDLLLGLMVCSQTYEDAQTYLLGMERNNTQEVFLSKEEKQKARQAVKLTKKWGKYVTKTLKKVNSFSIYEHLTGFGLYIKEGCKQPIYFFEDDKDEGTTGGHWSQSIKLSLMEAGYSESRVMNMPLSQAFHDYIKLCERSGTVSMATEDEVKQIEEEERHTKRKGQLTS
jgi:hypothetical protein